MHKILVKHDLQNVKDYIADALRLNISEETKNTLVELYDALAEYNVDDIFNSAKEVISSDMNKQQYKFFINTLKFGGSILLIGASGLGITYGIKRLFNIPDENVLYNHSMHGFAGISLIGICICFAAGH